MPFDGTGFHPSVVELFEAMLDFYGPGGERWTVGELVDDDGSRCLVGAMRHCRAKLKMKRRDKAAHYLRLAIRRHENRGAVTIIDFNDHLASSFADIRKVLTGARDIALGKDKHPRQQLELIF